MPKETITKVQEQSGLGNILIATYKYLRDNNILKGVFKNPLIVVRKTREAIQFYDKLILPSTTGTNKPIFTYKNISTDKEIRLCTFNVAVKSTKPVSLDMYKNSNLTAASWIAFDGSTTIQKDISAANKKEYWWQMIQLLPSSFNQMATIDLNYQTLRNIYRARKSHKLDEWTAFTIWISSLPYANELIIGE